MIEEECNVNLSLAVGGAGDAPSSRSLQQKKKTSLPFQFHNLFVRAQPKEEEEAKDIDCGGGGGKRKKLRLSTEQLNLLEESFKAHTTLAPVCTPSCQFVLLLFYWLTNWSISVMAGSEAGAGAEVAVTTKASGSMVSEQKGQVEIIDHQNFLFLAIE